jgi:hypothetical protein
MKLIYLCSPYTHKDKEVEKERYEKVTKRLVVLTLDGHQIFSPISYWHPTAMSHKLPTHYDFWRENCELMVSKCDELWVLTIDGWKESKGVTAEIKIADDLGLPIKYLK